MLKERRERIQASIVARIFRVQVQRNVAPPPPSPLVRQVMESGPADPDGTDGAARNRAPKKRSAPALAGAATAGPAAQGKTIRNPPFLCGLGQKYKPSHAH